MKTNSKSSARIEREKRLNIFRFSIAPTLTRSAILLALLLLFYFFLFPKVIFPAVIVVDTQIPLIGITFRCCRLLFLALVAVTLVVCVRTKFKKIRIRKGVLMYRYGIIFQKTKSYPLWDGDFEVCFSDSLLQRPFKAITLKLSGLNLEEDTKKKKLKIRLNGKGKKIVFRNVKQGRQLFSVIVSCIPRDPKGNINVRKK